jgi:hypothetical protein
MIATDEFPRGGPTRSFPFDWWCSAAISLNPAASWMRRADTSTSLVRKVRVLYTFPAAMVMI